METKIHYAVLSPYWLSPEEQENAGGNIVGMYAIYKDKADAEENCENPYEIMPIIKND